MRHVRSLAAGSWSLALALFLAACGGGGGAEATPGGPTGDGNDTPVTALALPLDTPTNGSIASASDHDYYRFITNGPGVVVVQLTGLTADVDMALYDGALTIVGHSVNAGAADDWVAFTAPAAGVFYLELFGNLGATSGYVVTVSTSQDDGNGSFAGAIPLAPGGAVIGDITSPADLDYFRVVVIGGTVTFTLTMASADLDLRLYDSSEALIATSANAGTSAETISRTVPAGAYYVVVESAGVGTSPFTLQYVFTAAGP